DSRKADFELMRAWDVSDCERGASEAFAVFMGSGWAYALVHPGRSEGEIPRVTWEQPSAAIVDRDPIYGDERIGMLSWIDDDFDYATLYTDEEVWRFRRSRTPDRWDSKLPSQGGGWELREDVDNPQRNPL